MDEPPSYSLQNILWDQSLLYFFVTAVLVVFSAWISALEAAFFTLSPEEMSRLNKSREPAQRRVARLMGEPRLLISALSTCKYMLLLGAATIAMAAVSWRATVSLDDMSMVSWLVLLTSVFAIAGVILPKIYAASKAREITVKYAGVADLVVKILKPLLSPILRMSGAVERILADKREENAVQEFTQALQLATLGSEPVEGADKILEGIVNFGTLRVKNVMRSRSEISFIDQALDFRQLIDFVRISGYSRIPVCDGSLDQIVGILYIKDLLPFLDEGPSFNWRKLIRPPYYVSEGKKVDFLLKDFQEKRVHIALVRSAEGKTSGLITLEDVIEEIIGDINDEFDEIGSRFQQLNENTWLFDGKMSVHDFCKVVGIDLLNQKPQTGMNQSLSAMVMSETGTFPNVGERVHVGQLTFVVETIDQKRIKKLRVHVDESKIHAEQKR